MSQARSITAYDFPVRIAAYDRDMDVMHPNRHQMVRVALGMLPFDCDAELSVLDLGVGTGFFTQRLLATFPNARVIAIDGAEAMIEVARERLGPQADRVDFRIGDFRQLDRLLSPGETGQVVISAYALHHVDAEAKTDIVRRCGEFLEPGGWFLNADLIVGDTARLETRFQELRVKGIVRRADPGDERFSDPERTRAFLDELEANEGDQPLTLAEDLDVLRAAGLQHAGVFWLETREAVTGAPSGQSFSASHIPVDP